MPARCLGIPTARDPSSKKEKMLRSLGLSPQAIGRALIPLTAWVAVACGGSDFSDLPETGPDASTVDASSEDARPSSDVLQPGSDRRDTDRSDTGPVDASLGDVALADAEAGPRDAEAGSRDAEAGLPNADVHLSDVDARVVDAEGGIDREGSFDADAGDSGGGLLGSAKNFAVLAGSTITITPSPPLTSIIGDVGVSPGTAIATLSPGQPVGTVYAGGPVALQAQSDLTVAYNALAVMPCLPANNRTGVDLGGLTLAPGVHCFDTSAGITGNLVLDAQLDPNAVWVIQVGSTLTTATNATVSVINGGSPCNVYWQIASSATLGTNTHLVGNIVALTSITLVSGSTVLVGRTLARNGGVTFDGNTVSAATCQ
jgi:hypothetical protein